MPDPEFAPKQNGPFEAFCFAVEIRVPGVSPMLCNAAFAECEGPSVTLETRTIREGGDNNPRIQFTGGRSYGLVTLRRGMSGDFGLWNWVDAFLQEGPPNSRPDLRADAVIVVLAPDGSAERARFVLRRCLPVYFKAPSLDALRGTIAIEELQLAYESLTLVGPGAEPSAPSRPAMAKAQLRELDADLRREQSPGLSATVQFNPERLRISSKRQVAGEDGVRDVHETAAGSTVVSRLSVSLWFDASEIEREDRGSTRDVRNLTREVARFMTPAAVSAQMAGGRPRGVRFTWGSLVFDGYMESIDETLEHFSSDGRPLRARVQIELVRDSIVDRGSD
jgi:phage tail-like protein